MSLEATTALLSKEYAIVEVSGEASAQRSIVTVVVNTVAVATICIGAVLVASGLACTVGLCSTSHSSASIQLYAAPVPVSQRIVNSKSKTALVLQRRPSALQATKSSNVQRERAAKLAITGLLSVAAMAQPAAAAGSDDRIAELMKAWNDEYGTEYGTWDMSGYNVRAAPAAPANAAREAPDIVIPKKAAQKLDPIEEVMAEWNKEYGSKYGTWDMSGYRPAKKVEAPKEEPVAPVAPVVPVAPVPAPAEPVKAVAEAPPAPAAVEEPVAVKAPAAVEEPVALKAPAAVEEPAAAPQQQVADVLGDFMAALKEPEVKAEAPAAPVPVVAAPKPAAAVPATEGIAGSQNALIAGGIALVVAGVAALAGNKEEAPAVPPANPTEGAAPPTENKSDTTL